MEYYRNEFPKTNLIISCVTHPTSSSQSDNLPKAIIIILVNSHKFCYIMNIILIKPPIGTL